MMKLLGDVPSGSVVKIKENDVSIEFIVVQQGKPSSSYDDSCDGTWVLRKNIHSKRAWNSGSTPRNYNQSSIHTFLNGTYLNSIQEDIRNVIQSAKIPYLSALYPDYPYGNYTAEMLCKVFLLSKSEVWPYSNMGGLGYWGPLVDGYPLEYFNGAAGNNPEIPYDGSKHISYYGYTPSDWYTRTGSAGPDGSQSMAYCVLAVPEDGLIFNNYPEEASLTKGVRPAFILPKELLVDDNGNVVTNQPPTAPSDIAAVNVVGNQKATVTLGAASDPDGTVENYIYERKVDSGAWQQLSSVNSLTITDFIDDSWTTVTYRAKAVDDDGAEGPYATSQEYTVVHNQMPTAPGSITVTNVIGGEQATIAIMAATDPDGTVVEYVYERNVDNGTYWQQIAQTSSLSVTDSVSSEWGTVTYRAKAMDNDGAYGPYATSETYDVNSGWIIISGPNENMGTRIAPFDLAFSIDVTGQSSVTDINVVAVMDGEIIYNGQIDAGVKVTIPIETRFMSFGTHKIVVSTSKDEYIPATNTYTFAIPAISIPPEGNTLQARSPDGKPIFWRGLGKDIICKNGLSVNDWIDAIVNGMAYHMKIFTGQYTGTGTYGNESPNTLTIGCVPMVMQVFEKDGTGILRVIATAHGNADGANEGDIPFETGGVSGEITQTGISWYGSSAEEQMNTNGKEYIWFVLGTSQI